MKLKVIVSLSIFFMVLVASISYGVKFTVEANSDGWTGTVYIRADGSIDPSDAPIQRDGNLYILTGNIISSTDGIVVERDNIVIDGAGHMLQGTGSGTGVDFSGRSNVTIKNITIAKFHTGICLYSSSNNSISGNNITDNVYGISLLSSSNVHVRLDTSLPGP